MKKAIFKLHQITACTLRTETMDEIDPRTYVLSSIQVSILFYLSLGICFKEMVADKYPYKID